MKRNITHKLIEDRLFVNRRYVGRIKHLSTFGEMELTELDGSKSIIKISM